MKTLLKVDITPVKKQIGGIFEITEDICLPSSEKVDFPQPVTVHAQITRTNEGYYVTGNIQGGYKTQCDRCLETIEGSLKAKFSENFLFRRRGPEKESDEKTAGTEEIDLTETLLETVTFALPMKYLCSSDCRGLCPVCGNNRNRHNCRCREEEIDPRLARLAEWKKQQGGGTNG